MEVILIFIGFAFVALIVRVIAGSVDHDRVEEYISDRGGRVIEKYWSPFGKGWFGSEHERIYEVKYEDKDGNIHQATCKTSMLSGVYFTEDKIVQYARNTRTLDRETELEIENLMLKQQIEDLKRKT
jgi:hypothetical protein